MKKAKIYTFTIIHTSSVDFKDKVPYAVAVLDDGKQKFSSFLEGYQKGTSIMVGQEVLFLKNDENGKPIYQLI